MAKRPNQTGGNPFDEEEATQAGESPLGGPAAAKGPDRTRIQASPFAAEPEHRRNPPRSLSSVKIDPGSGLQPERPARGRPSRPQAPAAPSHEEEAWDAPEGELAEATRVGLPPPVATRSSNRRVDPVEEAWGPAPAVDDANATRLAPMAPPPRERAPREPVDDENATQAGPPMTVEVVQGPDAGTRQPMRGGRMVVGRGEGCDFRLKDSATSRRHAELVSGPSGLVVRDLGSGNGTRVNGEKVTEAVVGHGDRIALGQTVLLVVDDLKKFEEQRAALAAPPPRRMSSPAVPAHAPPPMRRTSAVRESSTAQIDLPARPRGGGAGGALLDRWRELSRPMQLGVGGGAGLLLLLFFLAIGRSSAPPPPPPGPTDEEIRYDELFEEGKKALREGNPKDALERFEEAKEIFDKAELSRYIESCEREMKAVRLVTQAKSYAADGNFESALEALKGVDNLSATYDEAKRLSEEYVRRNVEAIHARIAQLIEEDDLDSARAQVDKLPADEASKARETLARAEKAMAANAADSARRARERAARAKKDAERKAQAEVDQALAGVVRKIDSGNIEGAENELDRVMEATNSKHVIAKVRSLRKLLPKFEVAYKEGVSKYNGGAYEQAAQPLLKALTLYEDMDLDGKLYGSLQSKVAKSMEMLGRGAMSRQEYGTAAKAFREALRFNPGLTEAKVALADIARKAKDVYLEGYVEVERNPDYARKRFRQVLDMVGPENDVHQDAKRRLADLDTK